VALLSSVGESASKLLSRLQVSVWLPSATFLTGLCVALLSRIDISNKQCGSAPTNTSARYLLCQLDASSGKRSLLLLAATILLAILVHPYATAALRLLEGQLPIGPLPHLLQWRTRRHLRKYAKLSEARWIILTDEDRSAIESSPDPPRHLRRNLAKMHRAGERSRRYPLRKREVQPTLLGNTLQAGYSRAGDIYGISVPVLGPRLEHFMSQSERDNVEQFRSRVELGAQLVFVYLALAVVFGAVVRPFPVAAGIVLGFLVIAIGSYLSTIRAAEGYSEAIAVLVDMHRFDLVRALHVEMPKNHSEEVATFELLSKLLDRDREPDGTDIRYRHPQTPDDAE
jgi:hypothetical protein